MEDSLCPENQSDRAAAPWPLVLEPAQVGPAHMGWELSTGQSLDLDTVSLGRAQYWAHREKRKWQGFRHTGRKKI